MKNLFLWYLPQAALFFGGVYFASQSLPPGSSGYGMAGFGILLAAAYTAAVIVLLDAPANLRSLAPLPRAAVSLLYIAALIITAIGAGVAVWRSGLFEGVIVAAGVGCMLSLVISLPLAFWTGDIRPKLLNRKARRAKR